MIDELMKIDKELDSLLEQLIDTRIILLIGEDGVGKSTVGHELCRRNEWEFVKSFTTRPPRENEEDEHIFVTKERYIQLFLSEGHLANQRVNGEYYGVLCDQLSEKGTYVYVVDELGMIDVIQELEENPFFNAELLKIYLTREDIDIEDERKGRVDPSSIKPFCDVVIKNDGSVDECCDAIMEYINQVKELQ